MSRFLRFCFLLVFVLWPLQLSQAQSGSRPRATAVFRGLGLLGSGASVTRTSARVPVASNARLASGSSALAAGDLQFSFQGYSTAQRATLQNFVNANYARMTAIYGKPAPEQTGKTVIVQNDAQITSAYAPPLPGGSTGGTIYFGYNDATSSAVNTYNFTRLALISFQGPRVPAFNFRAGNYVEPYLYGASDAAAILVAYAAAGSPANFDPSQLGAYVLPVYDYLNRPELGNAYIYPRNGADLVISDFRLAMAQAAFLKIAIENPQFFAQFNARLYARGAAGDPIDVAGLQNLAASVVPTVEGQNFNDWARRQYALDATVTTGQKLYLAVLPLPAAASGDVRSGFSAFAQAFTTTNDGSEIASTGYGSVAAYDETGRDISAFSAELRSNNVLAFNVPGAPGQASFGGGFSSFGTPDRALVTLKARFGQAEATGYFPYGAAGNTASKSSYFGGTLGGQNGTLQINGSAVEAVTVARGAWAATSSYRSGPRVQTAFTFGGAMVRRNTAWLVPGDAARSVAFLLEVPSALQNFAFNAPAGASNVRMVSLPLFPIKTDEAQALNKAPAALSLARYRPNLSQPILQNGALIFGISGARYEIYPNISAPLAPGRGYWLGVEQSGYATQVQGSEPPRSKPYEVPLVGGWNQIGVPFNRAFSTAAVQVRYGGFAPVSLSVAQTRGWVAPGVWRWLPAGGYVRADTSGGQLVPFEGYFIFAGAPRGVSLIFNANAANMASAALTAPGGWSVPLIAAGQQTRDIAGHFGISDEPNIAKPPTAARVVSLRFEGDDPGGAGAAGSGLAESYHAELGAGISWAAIVDGTTPGECVTLSWGNSALPRDVKLTLVDGTTGGRTAMKRGGQFQFTAGEAPRRFTIEAIPGDPENHAPENHAPKVAPMLTPTAPATGDKLTVVPRASDADGDALTLRYQWKNGDHVLKETGATLDLSVAGNGDRGDEISVEVVANDGKGGVTSGVAKVRVGNSVPVATDATLLVKSGQGGEVALVASDSDGDAFWMARLSSPAHGTADVHYDATAKQWKLFYRSVVGYTGSDEIKIAAWDGQGSRSQAASVRVTVVSNVPTNRAPSAQDGVLNVYPGESKTLALYGSDPDGDALAFRIVNDARYGNSEIKIDPKDRKWKLFYTSDAKRSTADKVTFVAVDPAMRTSSIATIWINSLNRQPTAHDGAMTVTAGLVGSIALSGTDPDGDEVTFRLVGGSNTGASQILRVGPEWKLFYRSQVNYAGIDSVRFVSVDADGRTSPVATILITVKPVTGTPVASNGSS